MARTERQAHGFIFQDWVVRTFLDMKYSGEWDIPAKINPDSEKPVSIKTSQWKSGGVGLGDILSQFDINEDFEMLIAFYVNNGKRKKIVNIQLLDIKKEKWREMWGNMKREDLEKFDNFVMRKEGRNLSGEKLNNFRADVQALKKNLFENYIGKFTINPKIDSGNQRRVQCSIGFNDVFSEFGLEDKKKEMKTYNLWGKEIKLSKVRLE